MFTAQTQVLWKCDEMSSALSLHRHWPSTQSYSTSWQLYIV